MAQQSKFIDITRTFIPVDPNSFPDSLHLSSREDSSPEDKVSVSAYKGYNFLPTSYGYKSYFGQNSKINIDALDARVDFVFIYQNLAYENILIALTETGIWIKKGEAVGAWVNSVPMSPPAVGDTAQHFEWTHAIIANKLYVYRQGQPSYQLIESDLVDGVEITTVVPSFLNMEGQVGIFKAAGRLAFWDSADAFSWANLDDFSDFEPSLETLAGIMKFASVQGRVVTVKAHGEGFIVYATKSIVYIQQNLDSLYQWNPKVILSNCGIQYPRQAVVASPDTVHFAWTPEGLKKIELAKEETIVPEVTDFFAEYDKPVYLNILGGRFLFMEMLDDDYLTGNVQITEEIVEGVDYTWPGGADQDIYATDPTVGGPAAECQIYDGITGGNFVPLNTFPDGVLPGTKPTPIWTCYLSNGGPVDADNIVWTGSPCPTIDPNGVEAAQCPSIQAIGGLSQTSSGKTAVTGAQAYVDGVWTIERFVQTQLAIWKAQDDARAAVISKITNRAKSVQKYTPNVSSCTASPVVRNECTIGRYPSKFSGPQFGYSQCEFWLTRYALEAIDLVRVKANSTSCDGFWDTATPVAQCAEEAALVIAQSQANRDACLALFPGGSVCGQTATATLETEGSEGTFRARNRYSVIGPPVSPGETITYSTWKNSIGLFNVTERMDAYNKGIGVPISPTPDSPYCVITGYSYTNAAGVPSTIAAGACNSPSASPVGDAGTKGGNGIAPAVSAEDGSLCGKPFEGAILDGSGLQENATTWPAPVVSFPDSSFLLQIGSIAPVYPTFAGALVYDLQLKKWGKMRASYKQLLDYSPLNSTAEGNVSYSNFGILGGTLGTDGKISLFDAYPADSKITYGKLGYYRLGTTSPQEVHVHFRFPSTGYVKVETSLGGKNLGAGLTQLTEFTNVSKVVAYGGYPGKWHNIEIGGIFDINYLEYRGFNAGRR